jgi:prepilin-type N-terminal cleavage/methylation domain-containing protein
MKTRSGFTLIEMLIVMAMTAIFAGFAAVLGAPVIRHAEFDRVRETVRNELVAAQADTVGGTLDSAWGVAFTTSTVTRYRGGSYATRVTASDRVTTFSGGFILSGATEVHFSRPTGLVSSTAVVVITSGTLQTTTTVNTAGSISVQ